MYGKKRIVGKDDRSIWYLEVPNTQEVRDILFNHTKINKLIRIYENIEDKLIDKYIISNSESAFPLDFLNNCKEIGYIVSNYHQEYIYSNDEINDIPMHPNPPRKDDITIHIIITGKDIDETESKCAAIKEIFKNKKISCTLIRNKDKFEDCETLNIRNIGNIL